MKSFFEIKIEFNKDIVKKIIKSSISNNAKGYVCVLDGNSLTNSNKNSLYKTIINNALVNICDGKSIALFSSFIYRKKFKTYTGPEFFTDFVIKNNTYRHYFLGNTDEILSSLKSNLSKNNIQIVEMIFESLPFKENIEDFDYEKIAKKINDDNPDFIWISLGAPKQDIFMSLLLPYISRGILVGVGAVFNFYSGIKKFKRAPKIFSFLGLEWLYRVFQEPKRISKRAFEYLKIIPNIIIKEIKIANKQKKDEAISS